MRAPKLLWLAPEAQAQECEYRELRNFFEILQVGRLEIAVQEIQTAEIDAVLVAGSLPGYSAIEVLQAIQSVNSGVPVVFSDSAMTAAEAVKLVRNGARNCLGLGDSVRTLRQSLEQACEESRHWAKRKPFMEPMPGIVGESRAVQDVVNTIRLVGPRRCTVLISGETGTGKDVAARAIHYASPRSKLPMVAVNCSALPEHLLEAELFGHVKGAFTGATNQRIGRFEQAHRSTLFLDEIGDMPLDLQAKLLRVLQDREFQRLGSSETIRVDVRVIAASNANLQEKIRLGKFREDLYYRLNVVPLRTPPLRERQGDIPLLIDHFVAKICEAEGMPAKQVTAEAKEHLSSLPWPGNVRQLENTVEMAIAMCGERDTLYPADFGLPAKNARVFPVRPAAGSFTVPESMDFNSAVCNFELALLNQALTKTGGNKTAAAELLGMKRTTLIMKLRGLQESFSMLPAAV